MVDIGFCIGTTLLGLLESLHGIHVFTMDLDGSSYQPHVITGLIGAPVQETPETLKPTFGTIWGLRGGYFGPLGAYPSCLSH